MKKDNGCMFLRGKPAVKNNSTMHKCIITMTTHVITMATYIITMATYVITLPSGDALLFNRTVFLVYAHTTKAIGYAILLFSIGSVPFGSAADPFVGSVMLTDKRRMLIGNRPMLIGNRPVPIGNNAMRYYRTLGAVYMIIMSVSYAPLPFNFVILLPGNGSRAMRKGAVSNDYNVLSTGKMVMPVSNAA